MSLACWFTRWRYKAMTPQIRQTADKHIESELDRLTYSAYLLTLDPGVAVSVVMTAIRGSLEEITSAPDLLERTVELALEQLDRESRMEGDGESSAFDAALCRRSNQLTHISIAQGPKRQPHFAARFHFPDSLRSAPCARVQAWGSGCENADGRGRISRAVAKSLPAIGIGSL